MVFLLPLVEKGCSLDIDFQNIINFAGLSEKCLFFSCCVKFLFPVNCKRTFFYFPETWSDLHRFSLAASNRPFHQSKVYFVAMEIFYFLDPLWKKKHPEKKWWTREVVPRYIYSLLKSWLCCCSLAVINEKKLSRIHVPCDKFICFSSCCREANFTPT